MEQTYMNQHTEMDPGHKDDSNGIYVMALNLYTATIQGEIYAENSLFGKLAQIRTKNVTVPSYPMLNGPLTAQKMIVFKASPQ